MSYKYKSVLKTFEYSKENYQIISDFLLSGKITSPEIMLKVTEISKHFGKEPKHWFQRPSVKELIIALIEIQCETNIKLLKKTILKFLEEEKIIKVRKSYLCKNSEFLDFLKGSDYKVVVKLAKKLNMIVVKRGNAELTNSVSGTWINRDLAVKYAEWLDSKFSIWVSQKILELVNDGVAWNEIRQQTKIDYKPLTDAIEKYVKPQYPKLDDNILYGRIANYINLRVKNQKAKEIREELKIADNELTRDYFKKLELQRIEEVQIYAKILIVQFKIFDFKTLEEKILNYEF